MCETALFEEKLKKVSIHILGVYRHLFQTSDELMGLSHYTAQIITIRLQAETKL